MSQSKPKTEITVTMTVRPDVNIANILYIVFGEEAENATVTIEETENGKPTGR